VTSPSPPVRAGTADPGQLLAAGIGDLVEGVFTTVAGLHDAVHPLLAGVPLPSGRPAVADLGVLADPVREVLADPGGLVVGAGYVAAPGVLADAPYWLQWWTVQAPGGRPEALEVETREDAEGFRDYTALPWYAVPAASGRRHVTGPYVDYLCTDEYSLTFTQPVASSRGFAGVVGADVYVRSLERLLVPRMREVARVLGARIALINAQGRVVCGSSADLVTGALVRDVPLGDLWAHSTARRRPGVPAPTVPGLRLHPCAGLPLGVLVRTD
jgi:hypothetical protein